MPVDESVAEVASSAPAEAASSAPDASPAEVLLAGNLGEGKSGVLGALLQGIQAVSQQVKELGQKVLRAPARAPELFKGSIGMVAEFHNKIGTPPPAGEPALPEPKRCA